jgi:hypothetical protein
MCRRIVLVSLLIGLSAAAFGAVQVDTRAELSAFEARLATYVETHRRLEGPLPPMLATSDMDEVYRLMTALRARIRAERKDQAQGSLLTPAVSGLLRERISSCMTADEIEQTMEDIEEHTPRDMPPVRVNEPLPEDAPFGWLPPLALRALPPLPPELRYVVLSKSLIIWDHHADMVVDIAPGVFDAATYRKRTR